MPPPPLNSFNNQRPEKHHGNVPWCLLKSIYLYKDTIQNISPHLGILSTKLSSPYETLSKQLLNIEISSKKVVLIISKVFVDQVVSNKEKEEKQDKVLTKKEINEEEAQSECSGTTYKEAEKQQIIKTLKMFLQHPKHPFHLYSFIQTLQNF